MLPSSWTLHLAGGRTRAIDRPLVMAILNATPDSFSDGGLLNTVEAVEARIQEVARQGADLLDVGAESTRPGHMPVGEAEEIRRATTVLEACRRLAPEIPVSIDTRKAAVAKAALALGAHFINDVSGLADARMAEVARDAKCSLVLMRSQPIPGEIVGGCSTQLQALSAKALAAGIPARHLILDPGLGFGDPPGASVAANQALIRGVAHYGQGLPVLIGASRKRFIGTLSNEPVPHLRVKGSVEAALLAVQSGAAIVRVHDVAETVEALRRLEPASGP